MTIYAFGLCTGITSGIIALISFAVGFWFYHRYWNHVAGREVWLFAAGLGCGMLIISGGTLIVAALL